MHLPTSIDGKSSQRKNSRLFAGIHCAFERGCIIIPLSNLRGSKVEVVNRLQSWWSARSRTRAIYYVVWVRMRGFVRTSIYPKLFPNFYTFHTCRSRQLDNRTLLHSTACGATFGDWPRLYLFPIFMFPRFGYPKVQLANTHACIYCLELWNFYSLWNCIFYK